MLPNIIRGRDPNIGFLIGGDAPPTEPDPPLAPGKHEAPHQITLGQRQNDVTGHRLLIATVRLFPFTGAPTYCAVVGEPGPKIIEQLS